MAAVEPNPFRQPELLHPELAADIAETQAWQAIHDPSAQVATTGIASVVQAAVQEAPGRAALAETLTRSEQLFARVNLTLPSPNQLATSGVNFPALSVAHERMTAEDLEPRFVLAPILSIADWQRLYADLEADPVVNHDEHIKLGGLHIDQETTKAWDDLSEAPDGVPVTLNITAEGWRHWTLRLIPGTNRPTETNITHDDSGYPDKPTVHECLTLQATLLQAGEDPIDDNTWTWLSGTFRNDLQASYGLWDSGGRLVYLQWFNVGVRDDSLCVRPAVWK